MPPGLVAGIPGRIMIARSFPFALFSALWFTAWAQGAEPKSEEVFSRDVQPILTAHCVECHGPKKQENGLRLDFGAAILRGGDSGPAVVAGKAAESLLMQAVLGTSDTVSRMPLKKPPLSEAQVAMMRRWIDAGAKVPADAAAETTEELALGVSEASAAAVAGMLAITTWPSGPIDAFVLARLEQEGLAHSTRPSGRR